MSDFQDNDFDVALFTELARLSDNSMRDGQQSLDANRIPAVLTASVIPAYQRWAETLNDLAQQEKIDFDLPAYEFWGGGEFGQPAQFLGENPFTILRAMKALAPDVPIKALYRGRQGYGFDPIHDDTQHAALEASFDNGVDSERIFDMSNDWNNLGNAVNIAIEERDALAEKESETASAKQRKIIGSVCYTKPTDKGEMAWTPEMMADLAVKFAEAGVDIVEIKDYAGNLQSEADAKAWMEQNFLKVTPKPAKDTPSDDEHIDGLRESTNIEHWVEAHYRDVSAASVVDVMRTALDKAGYENVPLHLHSHGHKPEALDEALDAGAAVVDVGIGKLSGHYEDQGKDTTNTLAFTNIRDILSLRMAQHGFDISEYQDHPVFEALQDIESSIEQATSPVIDKRRERMKVLAKVGEDELATHCMAGGAITALYSLIEKQWQNPSMKQMIANNVSAATISELQDKDLLHDSVTSAQDIDANTHFLMALKLSERLWEDAGAFATVTPGAKICAEQAASASVNLMMGRPIAYSQAYKDVVAGRYGFNHGVDKGIGNTDLHTTILGDKKQALFPAPEGHGLEIAKSTLHDIDTKHHIDYRRNEIPDKNEAALLVALTSKDGKAAIAESLLHYLDSGERTGLIEPSRTILDGARSSETLQATARIIDTIGLKDTEHLYHLHESSNTIAQSKVTAAAYGRDVSNAAAYKTINQWQSQLESALDPTDLTAFKRTIKPDNDKIDLMALYQDAIEHTQPKSNLADGDEKRLDACITTTQDLFSRRWHG